MTDVSKIGFAKLTLVLDKLTDLARGIERLGTALNRLADGRFAAICSEMSLASDSLDDIPNREVLKLLLSRVEREAAAVDRQ